MDKGELKMRFESQDQKDFYRAQNRLTVDEEMQFGRWCRDRHMRPTIAQLGMWIDTQFQHPTDRKEARARILDIKA